MSGIRRRRSTGSDLVHVSVAVKEALDFLQATVEFRAEQDGALVGPILPEQRRASGAIDRVEKLRQELEDSRS